MSDTIKKVLYGHTDPVGSLLSAWRNRVVAREVNGLLIDLACGDNRLVRATGGGIGVDVNSFSGADIVAPSLEALPIESASADTISVVASLNYFPDPVAVLVEARRILRHDGKLLVTMSNATVMKYWHKLRDRGVQKTGYTDEAVQSILLRSGFRVERRIPFMLGINVLYVARKDPQQ